MSFTIPPQIERDILGGKAVFRSFQIGYGGQSVLRVPENSYIMVYGYDFSPAGNGLTYNAINNLTENPGTCPIDMAWLGTQQISFYNGSDFYPYLHNIPVNFTELPTVPTEPDFVRRTWRTQCEPISRQLYIASDKNLAITVGLVLQGNQIQVNATPQTTYTPNALTYGGSGQNNNATLELNVAGNRNFVQPQIPTDIYGFTPLSANTSDELYWFPDTTYGFLDPMLHIQTVWGQDAGNLALCNYKLCVHYALYNRNA